jgi:hypothetical protein
MHRPRAIEQAEVALRSRARAGDRRSSEHLLDELAERMNRAPRSPPRAPVAVRGSTFGALREDHGLGSGELPDRA